MITSALEPAGPQAARIAHLWWFTFAVLAAVFVLVIAALLAAVFWPRRGEPPAETEVAPALTTAVGIATAVTVLTLFVLLVASVRTGRALSMASAPQSITVEVTGHQWWWEVRYPNDADPSQGFVTANEIHVPVGRSVALRLQSNDVIHSFWVPSLHGKMDLIPGHQNWIWLQADREGVFGGRCAEFCGMQHAHMAFNVVAEPADRFLGWLARQRQPAAEPADEYTRRGRAVFLSLPCVMCHTIRGTPSAGTVAPDLTHVAGRLTIAAGTLPNTRGHMAGWLVDPQGVKPGNKMPPNSVEPDDLQALLAYLETLR